MIDRLPFLSDDFHIAIASVASRAAQLDAQIEISIAILLVGAARSSKYILKNMNGDKYVGLLEQMLLDINPDNAVLIERVFKRVSALRTARNEILHWLYGHSPDPTVAIYATQRPHRDRQERTRTAAEISAVASEMLDLVMVLAALAALARKPFASPDILASQARLSNLTWQEVLARYEKGEPLLRPQDTQKA